MPRRKKKILSSGVEACELHSEAVSTECNEGESASPLECVIKVSTTHATPCYASPWKTSAQWSSVGSAFPIDGKRLITNAHVIANAHLIHVRRSDGHRKFTARVEAMCFECDLAVLSVSNGDFWSGLHTFQLAESLPALQDEITVVGFPDAPCGGDSVCVTRGVVSRIDLHAYSWESHLLVVQIDAAINAGNSGGPCVDEDGLLVGVAFQKGVDSGCDNIGYIIPTPVVQLFLTCYETQSWGFGCAGFNYSLLDNPSLRDAMGVPDGVSGVLVTSVEPTASANHSLVPAKDVILKIDGHEIGHDGTVSLTSLHQISKSRCQKLRISFEWLFRKRRPGDTIEIEVLQCGVRRQVFLPLESLMSLVPCDPLCGERLGTQPEYLLIGGLVFVPLSEPFLTEVYGSDWESCPSRLQFLWRHGKRKHKAQQVVLLSAVLACEFTQGYDVHTGLPVEMCDGHVVENLAHLAELVDSCRGTFLDFRLANDQIVALRRDCVGDATQVVLKLNQIAKSQHIIAQR